MTARVGDIGIGKGFKTLFIKGESSVKINGMDAAVVTTVGVVGKASLDDNIMGPTTLATKGDDKTKFGGEKAHNKGSQGLFAKEKYVVATGSPDVLVDDK